LYQILSIGKNRCFSSARAGGGGAARHKGGKGGPGGRKDFYDYF
jgi:hypothetical protein